MQSSTQRIMARWRQDQLEGLRRVGSWDWSQPQAETGCQCRATACSTHRYSPTPLFAAWSNAFMWDGRKYYQFFFGEIYCVITTAGAAVVRRWSAYNFSITSVLLKSAYNFCRQTPPGVGREPFCQKLTFAPLCCRSLLACVCEGQRMFQLDRCLLSSRTNRAV